MTKDRVPFRALFLLFGIIIVKASTSFAQSGWTPQDSGTTTRLLGVSFVDADTGWVVGDDGTILATADGGATWTPQGSGTTRNLYGVSFVDGNTGTAVGEVGTILRTTDGGATWAPQDSGTFTGLLSVSFMDAYVGTAVGRCRRVRFLSSYGSEKIAAAKVLPLPYTSVQMGNVRL